MVYTSKSSIKINTTPDKVWEVLTTPELISEYLFGTQVESNWEVGSPIIYKGVWQGQAYEDKGIILEMEPNQLFKSSYWSSASGKEDIEENYNIVSYILNESDGSTELTIVQEDIPTEDEAKHLDENWSIVLEKIKNIAENLIV